MGGALQRLEILLVALVLVGAGGAAALVMTLQPLAPIAAVPTVTPTLSRTPATTPTTHAASRADPTSLEATAPPLPPASDSTPSATSPLRAMTTTAWPWLLLGAAAAGFGLTRRRTRLGYTNQSVRQLFAASDPVTHAANMRVVRDLAQQGLLTPELAAATGAKRAVRGRRLALRLPRPRLPRLVLPRPRPPRLALPPVRLAMLRRLNVCLPHRPTRALESWLPSMRARTSVRDSAPHASSRAVATAPAADAAARPAAPVWSAEDRALAVASLLTTLWAEQRLRSRILAFDTASRAGSGAVVATLEAHPDEERHLADLPAELLARRPAWRAAWRRGLLELIVAPDGMPPAGGPLLAPVLAAGRGGSTTRFYPLFSWRHLGLYGTGAHGGLHALLVSLLFAQPPADLALAFLDHGEVAPLYRGVAHTIAPPADARTTVELLTQAIRRGGQDAARPLLLVVVEPDDTLLPLLHGLAGRLQTRPGTPLHLLIVQTQPRPGGRELYALLPALIAGDGAGAPNLLPGQGAWPRRGQARLIGRGLRSAGRAIALDEAALAAQLAPLRVSTGPLPPVLWDAASGEVAAALSAAEQRHAGADTDRDGATADIADDRAARRRRLMHAIVARRQPLIDATLAPAQDPLPRIPVPAPPCSPTRDAERGPAPAPLPAATGRAVVAEPGIGEEERGNAWLGDLLQLDALPRAEQLTLLRPAPARIAAPDDRPTSPGTPPAEPENGWPAGPAPLGRAALADLMARVVADSEICHGVGGDRNSVGVSKHRLLRLLSLPKSQGRPLAETLMLWMDLAGLLTEPTHAGGRLRHNRPLQATELRDIAARLGATPIPDSAAVRAAWDGVHDERGER